MSKTPELELKLQAAQNEAWNVAMEKQELFNVTLDLVKTCQRLCDCLARAQEEVGWRGWCEALNGPFGELLHEATNIEDAVSTSFTKEA